MIHTAHKTERAAFTLVEMLLVSTMMTVLAMLLTVTWSALGRPLTDAATRSRICEEANLAAASLARDFGGNLASSDGRLGFPANGKLVGRMQPGDTVLRLCYDSGNFADGLAEWADPDTVISYQVQNGSLVTWMKTPAHPLSWLAILTACNWPTRAMGPVPTDVHLSRHDAPIRSVGLGP